MGRSSPSERRTSRRPGSPRARLFVALDPPEDARAALAAWRDRVVAGRGELRAVPEPSLHVTLAFLGYRPEKEIAAIGAAVAAACGGLPAAQLAPGRVRPLPPRSPRLFALDLADATGACGRVQRAVVEALAEGRFHEPEKRAFWPHLTFARVKRGVRAASLPDAEPPAPFVASAVVLYRSLLRPQGATYDPLATVRLEPPA